MKILFLFLVALIFIPSNCLALSGEKTDNTEITVYFRRSPEWKDYVKVLRKRADYKGVLIAENVPEGWYKLKVSDSDEKDDQKIAVKLKVLTNKGQYVKNAKVKLYTKVGIKKIFIKEVKSDEKGWIESEGLIPKEEYYIEVNTDRENLRNFSKKK